MRSCYHYENDLELNINETEIKWSAIGKRGIYSYEASYSAPLTLLKSARQIDKFVYLKLIGEYAETRCFDRYDGGKETSYSYSKKEDWFTFEISNEEMRERMYNAFSHLAKLATEKREADRKASGDKF